VGHFWSCTTSRPSTLSRVEPLIVTSAWVEFLRQTESPVSHEVRGLLDTDAAVTDPVVMEVLAGARDDRHLHDLRALLGRAERLACGAGDFEVAALMYRSCRQQGATVRKLVDCLIAAVAVRHGTAVVHADAGFDVIARHTALTVHPLD